MRRTWAYKVISSGKEDVRIDEEELEQVLAASVAGKLVVCKRGVVNPSFVVNIVPDMDRVKAWQEECRYGAGQGDEAFKRGMNPLPHIYNPLSPMAEMVEKKRKALEAQYEAKQLSTPGLDNTKGGE